MTMATNECLSVHAGIFRCELGTGHTGNHRLKRTVWRDAMVTDEPSGLTPERKEQVRAQLHEPLYEAFTAMNLSGLTRADGIRHRLVAKLVEAVFPIVATQRAELERAQMLAADATEYRVHLPENGGTTLHVKRQSGVTGGVGWAVSVPGYGGGRAWTMEGWQDSISALSVDRLFCWPSAEVAREEARRALADEGA